MTLFNHLESLKEKAESSPIQLAAWQRFLQVGLPSKKNEQYRYVRLRDLYEKPLSFEQATVSKEKILPHILPECQNSYLVFINGHYSSELSQVQEITVLTLKEGYRQFGSFLEGQAKLALKKENDPFHLLNTALYRDGVCLYLTPGQQVKHPVQIIHYVTGENMSLPCLHLIAGRQSSITLASTHAGETSGLINQSEQFYLEEGASVTYLQSTQKELENAFFFDACRAKLKKESTFTAISASNGAKTMRSDYTVALNGENASASLEGAFLLNDKREAHVNVLIEHSAPNTHSNQRFKMVLEGMSRSSFEGKIYVDPEAQKTEAYQLNNNLLLSDTAFAYSKPNLEIFADDVKASHGTTVGQLNAEEIFYLKSRGVSEKEASTLLTKGFYQEVTNKIPLPSLKEPWM